jgi:hypothetical protein
MSQADVDAIIAKAKSDPSYLQQLETNFNATVSGYNLTQAEKQEIAQALGFKLPQGRSTLG